MRRRLALAGALLAAVPLMACRAKALEPGQFVGRWKSSRSSAPVLLNANGEWEIRAEDGALLQYGVWRLDGQQLIWTVRSDEGVVHDATQVLSMDPKAFTLRERDGSTTRFARLD